MNHEKYNQIITFLKEGLLPEDLSERSIRQFIKEAENYHVKGSRLYLKNKENKIKVLKVDEIDTVLFMLHNHETAGHFGEEATYNRVKE